MRILFAALHLAYFRNFDSVVRELAVRVFRVLRGDGLARVDFFFEEHGRGFLCNEVNTMPGFTPISMYPKLWIASGLSYSELIDELVILDRDELARVRSRLLNPC